MLPWTSISAIEWEACQWRGPLAGGTFRAACQMQSPVQRCAGSGGHRIWLAHEFTCGQHYDREGPRQRLDKRLWCHIQQLHQLGSSDPGAPHGPAALPSTLPMNCKDTDLQKVSHADTLMID